MTLPPPQATQKLSHEHDNMTPSSSQKRQDILSKLEGLLTPKEPPKKKKTGAFIELEESDPVFTSSPAAELRKQDVDFLKILPSAIHGIYKMQGPVGPRGPRGESVRGEKGDKGEKGDAGIDGETMSVEEMVMCADKEVKAHEKKFDHKMIHDPKILGELELADIKEGQIFQRIGNKIVGIDLPKQGPMQQIHGGGNSIQSFSVTQSRELDAKGRYVVDATSGDITITVPSAEGREGHFFEIIRIDATANTVTVNPTGSETFSSYKSYVLMQWTNFEIFAFNGNYLIRNAS